MSEISYGKKPAAHRASGETVNEMGTNRAVRRHRSSVALFLFFSSSALCLLLLLFLPLSYLPEASRPVFLLRSSLRSASAEEIDRALSAPIERWARTLAEVEGTASLSQPGRSFVYVTFDIHSDGDEASLRLRRNLSEIAASLPEAVEGPWVRRGGEEESPIWAAAFPTHQEAEALRFADRASALSTELRIEAPAKQNRHLSIGVDGIRSASRLSPSRGLALFDNQLRRRRISFPGGGEVELSSAEELFDPAGLARSLDGRLSTYPKEKETIQRIDGEPCLFVSAFSYTEQETMRLCRKLEHLRREYPEARTVFNRGEKIGGLFKEVLLTVPAGILLVGLLLHRRGGGLSSLALFATIPVSLSTSFLSLLITGNSLNLMSLAAAAVSVGLCIDGSVLAFTVLRLHGRKAFRRHTAMPVLLSSLTTAAVFLPLAFFPPQLRLRFEDFALVLLPSLAASTLYTLFLLPLLIQREEDPIRRVLDEHRAYRSVFLLSLPARRHFLLSAALVALVLSLVFLLSPRLTFVPYPPLPSTSARFRYEFPPGTLSEYREHALQPVEAHLLSLGEDVRLFISEGEAEVSAVPKGALSKRSLTENLEKRFSRLSFGGRLFIDEVDNRRDRTEREEAAVPVLFFAPSYREACARALQGANGISDIPGLEVSLHFTKPSPLIGLRLAPRAFSLGAFREGALSDLFWSLTDAPFERSLIGGTEKELYFRGEFPAKNGSALSTVLRNIGLQKTADGPPAPPYLFDLVSVERSSTYHRFHRRDAVACAGFTVRAKGLRKDDLIARLCPRLPGAICAPDRGRELALGRSILLFIFSAVLVVAVLLYAYFKELRPSLATLLQIPLSYILPILLLLITGTSLSVPVLAGFLLLTGVSVNNGIVLFGSGKGENDLIPRFAAKNRPLMLSAFTTAAGVLPSALAGFSPGGVLAPLSMVIASGIVGSLLFLYVQAGLLLARRDRAGARPLALHCLFFYNLHILLIICVKRLYYVERNKRTNNRRNAGTDPFDKTQRF